MPVKVACTSKRIAGEAAAELSAGLGAASGGLVLYFASSFHEEPELSAALHTAFPRSTVVGATSAGQMCGGRLLRGSVTAMHLGPEMVSAAHVQVVHGLREGRGLGAAMAAFGEKFGESPQSMDINRYLGLVLMDGLSRAEERVMGELGGLTKVRFVGGSAADEMAFKSTHVLVEGAAYTNAAVLVMMKMNTGFDVAVVRALRDTGKRLRVTRAEEGTGEVIEFGGQLALKAYAEAVGASTEKAHLFFRRNPLGLVVEGRLKALAPRLGATGGRIGLLGEVARGMEFAVLEAGDVLAEAEAAIQEKHAALGGFAGVVSFQSAYCLLDIEARQGGAERYAGLFKKVPSLGVGTYGEQYMAHNSHTMTMLMLRQPG